jgi:hypothetical protein
MRNEKPRTYKTGPRYPSVSPKGRGLKQKFQCELNLPGSRGAIGLADLG